VTFVNQKAALALGAFAGAASAVILGRRRLRVRPAERIPADSRAKELREKLDEARSAAVDEAEFDAAGMGAETIVTEEPRRREPPPSDEFEAMRRRIHEEARAAADEMRRAPGASDAQ
jgi:hypothetical protein